MMKKLVASILSMTFAFGCGVQGECNPVEGTRVCVLYGTPEEVEYTGWVIDQVFEGRENMKSEWKVLLYDDVWELNNISDPALITPNMRCRTGYVHEQNLVIHAVPEALPHEFFHVKIMEDSNWELSGYSRDGVHTMASGWGTDSTERVREIDLMMSEHLPYESELSCQPHNRGGR